MVGWINTCSKVEHVEVWREVVSDVPSGQMVQIGLIKKLPTIPAFVREDTRVNKSVGSNNGSQEASIKSNQKQYLALLKVIPKQQFIIFKVIFMASEY